MKRSNVTVVLIKDSKNPEFKQVFVKQEITNDVSYNPIGFLLGKGPDKRVRYAWATIHASHAAKLEVGSNMTSILGQSFVIKQKDSFTPFYAGQTPKMNKAAEQGGIPLSQGGRLIYSQCELTIEGAANAADERILADNLKAVTPVTVVQDRSEE